MTPNVLRTLVVEDNLPLGGLMRSVLEPYGHCDIAIDGREALRAFEAAHVAGQPYDLVCLDIMMPTMDGRETLRRIRQLEEGFGILPGDGCKVLMTTALGDPANVMGAFSDQCDGYLVKPIDPIRLIVAIKRLGLLTPAEVET